MKKFTLVALALAMTLGASAQRKTWDFTKGFSASTISALQASFEAGKTWTDYEKVQGEGTGKYYINLLSTVNGTACTYDADGNATPIPEFEGLTFNNVKKKGMVIVYNNNQSENAGSPNGLYTYGTSFLWLNGKKLSFSLKAPQSVPIRIGIESHKNTENRGYDVIVDGNTLTPTSGNNSPIFFNEVEWQLPEATDGTDSVTVTIRSNNGAHIYYIIVGDGDEPEVEENKKIGYIYNPDVDPESTITNIYLNGTGTYDVTSISAASSDVTLDSLQKFDALVIDNDVPADATLVPTLKSAVAYEPIVNLDSKLYSAWGYGSEVATETTDITVKDESATLWKNWDGFDTEATSFTLTADNITGVNLGDYFAADDTLATAGDAVAIHQHNKLRNTYIFLPYGNTDLTTVDQDNFSPLLTAAVTTATNTKTDVTKATKPRITQTYKDQETLVTLSSQKGATIYYTTDGTEPTTSSSVYTDTISLTNAATLKAMATADGYLESDVASSDVVIKSQAKTPTIEVAQEEGQSTVTLASQDEGVSIYYNFSGSSETTASQVYTEPIVLTESATITAFAAGGDFVQSENATKDIEIQGQTAENTRRALLKEGHFNAMDWYDGSKALYPFSWGKTAQSMYVDGDTTQLAAYEVAKDTLGWKIISRGETATLENTTFSGNVGDGNGYNPATVNDAMVVATTNNQGNIEVTKCVYNMNAAASGEDFSAAVQSTNAFQGPFDVVIYCANGNGSNSPEIALQTSTTGEDDSFTTLGDTLVNDQARRLYKRFVVSYDGTDKVYLRVAHVGGGSKAMVADIYVLGQSDNEDVADGISNINASEENAITKPVKVIENGRLVIKTAKGTYTIGGVRIK